MLAMRAEADVDEVTTVYDRLRAVQQDGASLVDALASFLRERAALEEQYGRSLARLAKNSLVVNGAAGWRHAWSAACVCT